MSADLLALTLWPEWAWAIHHLDKRVENRGWPIPGGSWYALHAGKNVGGRAGVMPRVDGLFMLDEMARRAGWGRIGSHYMRDGGPVVDCETRPIQTSAIVGLFRVTAHLRSSRDPWHVPGQIGNRFEYVPLATPVPCKGAQGLWRVPPDVAAKVLEQVPEVARG